MWVSGDLTDDAARCGELLMDGEWKCGEVMNEAERRAWCLDERSGAA